MIPYIATRDLNSYGQSSKNALKREVLTLINGNDLDRISSSAHRLGALPLEYLGYIQKLQEINKDRLPEIHEMTQYAGVIIWLSNYYKEPSKLIRWVLALNSFGIKTVFVDNFGLPASDELFKSLGIKMKDVEGIKTTYSIIKKDPIIGFEIDPPMNHSINIQAKNATNLLTYARSDGMKNTTVAITQWGGYAFGDSFMTSIDDETMWVVNPFEFFPKTLQLKKMISPDVTTENGKRLLFTHIDGDGIMNKVEWNTKLFSGNIILKEVLQKYQIPHSVSVIGAEINNAGLYPDIPTKLQDIVKDMYKEDNVEAATHTFTHPFYWNKIINGNLPLQYRLKVKNYKFSLDREIKGALEDINTNVLEKNKKKANCVFWSGDCAPTELVLDNIYANKILNINGGDTYVNNTQQWMSYIGPLGLQRGEYYQIYTGAQNENIYTNNWLGPFWGFKKVVQTFKRTNSPRRFKPIDIYYHMYSGSKRASLNALHYAFDWAIKQDVMPIYTSEYIPKVMDYYTASIANENDAWLFAGMINLKTLRIEEEKTQINMQESSNVLGFNHFENHTYVHLGDQSTSFLYPTDQKMSQSQAYLVSSNAKVIHNESQASNLSMSFNGHVDLKFELYLPKSCQVNYSKKPNYQKMHENILSIKYKNLKKVDVHVLCKL